MAEIPAVFLVDEDATTFTKSLVDPENSLKINLFNSGGPVEIGGGNFGRQTIQSIEINQDFESFLVNSLERLDHIIDLDFEISSGDTPGQINFYLDEEIELGQQDSVVLGIAINNNDGLEGEGWWEVILNYPAFNANTAYTYYASLHEFGHTLGLEHDFDDSDGDVFQSVDYKLAAFPEKTVMAYRQPETGTWPMWYSNSDLNAFVSIWGSELQLYGIADDVIEGEDYSEKINGSRGNDRISGGGGYDILLGGKDNDWINGNQGDDEIFGNLGDDTLLGGKDNDWINGNQGDDEIFGNLGDDTLLGGKDNDRINGNQGDDEIFGNLGDDTLFGGQDNDWIDGGAGNDSLHGGYGADTFHLSAGIDVIQDFNPSDGDRIQLGGETIKTTETRDNSTLLYLESSGLTTLQNIQINQDQISLYLI